MKLLKFYESVNKEEIEDLLLDFKDQGYEKIECDIYEGVVTISGLIRENVNKVDFLKDVIELNNRVILLGYTSLNEHFHVYTGTENRGPRCSFMLKFKDQDVNPNKDVKSFEEFKTYLEKHLNLQFYEFDSEVFIPDLDSFLKGRGREEDVIIKLDVDREQNKFIIIFEKGELDDIHSSIDISDVVMTDDEWAAANLWSIPNSDRERFLEPELQKRSKSKVFSFDKRGIEAVEKCIEAVRRQS
jgi:hypothetical protein